MKYKTGEEVLKALEDGKKIANKNGHSYCLKKGNIGNQTEEWLHIKYYYTNPQMNRTFAMLENGVEVDCCIDILDLLYGDFVDYEDTLTKGWKPALREYYLFPSFLHPDFYNGMFNNGTYIDNQIINSGNAYRTIDKAVEVGKKMYYRLWFENLSDITEEDWKDEKKEKWYVQYFLERIEFQNVLHTRNGIAYFSSVDKLQEAINTIGKDNLIKYVLGVSNYGNN